MMIKHRTIFILLTVILSGCTTLGSLERNYDRITFNDGIDEKEARIIAQREYLQKDTDRNYKVGSAKVYSVSQILGADSNRIPFVTNENIYTDYKKQLKFSDSWFVSFRPKFLNFFSSYYLIIVNKKDGAVLYEHDSNVFGELFEGLFKQFLEPRIVSALAVGMYYMDKKEMPDTVEQLKQYLDQLPADKRVGYKELDGMKTEKVSATRLKVNYEFQDPQEIMEELPQLGKLLKSAYELEIKPQGKKMIMQITGDVKATFELGATTEVEKAFGR